MSFVHRLVCRTVVNLHNSNYDILVCTRREVKVLVVPNTGLYNYV